MEYHLDREIRFVEDTEHKELQPWCLQEFNQDGKAVSRQFIPWPWSIQFIVSELELFQRVEINTDENKKCPFEEYITLKLKPVGSSIGAITSAPRFSMFGTDRLINSFTAQFRRIYNGTEPECAASGYVSYTSEIDFREHTTDDDVHFEAFLRPEDFDSIKMLAQQKVSADSAYVSIKAAGFYSEWSPAISTDFVKVLTRDPEQKVTKASAEQENLFPRLGKVSEFSLIIKQNKKLHENSNDKADKDFSQDKPEGAFSASEAQNYKSIEAILNKIRQAAYIICAILIVMLLRQY